VIDFDVFDETNLNRQALSDVKSIGKSKSGRAAGQVESINPAVQVDSFRVEIDYSGALKVFAGADVVVDALDNIPDRFVVEKAAKALQIPLIHGAIAGFDGQLMTIFPEDPGLTSLYGNGNVKKNDPSRPGAVLGVPALTPSIIATLQAMEVIKVILKRGNLFRNKLLHIDLESGQFNQFGFGKES
jgi:molybdopterin/thiamine biosynthesis adenylyltransferase